MKNCLIGALLISIAGCAHYPDLSELVMSDTSHEAIIVMGYSTKLVSQYEGGSAYSGMFITHINEKSVGALPLERYDYRPVPAGTVVIKGACYWYVRGDIWNGPDDLNEPVYFQWDAQPNYVYTLSIAIDEYDPVCRVSLFAQAFQHYRAKK